MIVVGLTGGIGAGKSTVSAMLAERGAAVIDVDQLGREVQMCGGRAVEAVASEFGAAVRGADGGIDRPALARIVFADPAALARLTAIVHPAIDAELVLSIAGLAHSADPPTVVVLDMAVLAESRLGRGIYEVVVVVEAPVELRIERAVARGMARDDVLARMTHQASDEDRRQIADVVIVNAAGRAELEAAVDDLWLQLSAWRSVSGPPR